MLRIGTHSLNPIPNPNPTQEHTEEEEEEEILFAIATRHQFHNTIQGIMHGRLPERLSYRAGRQQSSQLYHKHYIVHSAVHVY